MLLRLFCVAIFLVATNAFNVAVAQDQCRLGICVGLYSYADQCAEKTRSAELYCATNGAGDMCRMFTESREKACNCNEMCRRDTVCKVTSVEDPSVCRKAVWRDGPREQAIRPYVATPVRAQPSASRPPAVSAPPAPANDVDRMFGSATQKTQEQLQAERQTEEQRAAAALQRTRSGMSPIVAQELMDAAGKEANRRSRSSSGNSSAAAASSGGAVSAECDRAYQPMNAELASLNASRRGTCQHISAGIRILREHRGSIEQACPARDVAYIDQTIAENARTASASGCR